MLSVSSSGFHLCHHPKPEQPVSHLSLTLKLTDDLSLQKAKPGVASVDSASLSSVVYASPLAFASLIPSSSSTSFPLLSRLCLKPHWLFSQEQEGPEASAAWKMYDYSPLSIPFYLSHASLCLPHSLYFEKVVEGGMKEGVVVEEQMNWEAGKMVEGVVAEEVVAMEAAVD